MSKSFFKISVLILVLLGQFLLLPISHADFDTTTKSNHIHNPGVEESNHILKMMRQAEKEGKDPKIIMEYELARLKEERNCANQKAWKANKQQKQIASDEAYAKQLQAQYDNESNQIASDEAYAKQLQAQYDNESNQIASDAAYAKQLQAQYDKESKQIKSDKANVASCKKPEQDLYAQYKENIKAIENLPEYKRMSSSQKAYMKQLFWESYQATKGMGDNLSQEELNRKGEEIAKKMMRSRNQ